MTIWQGWPRLTTASRSNGEDPNGVVGASQPARGLPTTEPRQMNVTERSPKAEIIDAACELTGYQSERIAELEQRQVVLWALVALLTALQLF